MVTVLTGADVPGEGDTGANRHDEPLFPVEVMFHHQPVAWVLADTLEAARRGAARVQRAYEPLPAILTIEQAIEAGSFLTDPLRIVDGDMPLRSSELRSYRGRAGDRRPGAFLSRDAGGDRVARRERDVIAVHSSTQHPSETQDVVARVLGVPAQSGHGRVPADGRRVRRQGSAGQRVCGDRRARRVEDAAAGARPADARARHGADRQAASVPGAIHRRLRGRRPDRTLSALRCISDGGWSLDLSEPIMWRSLFHCDNAYHLPAVEVDRPRLPHAQDVADGVPRLRRTAGHGRHRGDPVAGRARGCRLPADVVRERNFYRDGDDDALRPDASTTPSRIDADLERAEGDERVRRAPRARSRASTPRSRTSKRGLAITPVKFGISFTATFFNQAGALVLVYRDGSVQVNHGGTEMGQGLFTKIQQIAADSLGVPLRRVRVMPTRTDKVPNTSATAASAGTDLNGAAVADACAQIQVAARRRRRRSASTATPRRVRFDDGRRVAPGNVDARSRAVRGRLQAARAALRAGLLPHAGHPLRSETGRGTAVPLLRLRRRGVGGRGRRLHRRSIRLLRTDILQDVGDSISPIVDRGQIEGGFLQGRRLADASRNCCGTRRDASRPAAPRPTSCRRGPRCPRSSKVQTSGARRAARRRVGQQGGRRAAADAGHLGARGDPRRRRGVRGRRGRHVRSPATPERVFFAVRHVRRPALK